MFNKRIPLIAGALALLFVALLLIVSRSLTAPGAPPVTVAPSTMAPQGQATPLAKAETVSRQTQEFVGKPPGLYDAELAISAMQKGGCGACHVIPGLPNAVGTIGPNLTDVAAMVQAHLQGGKDAAGESAHPESDHADGQVQREQHGGGHLLKQAGC